MLCILEKKRAGFAHCETAALVHDVIDDKLPETVRLSLGEVYNQLVFFGIEREAADRVIHIITRMSFRDRKKLDGEPLSIEGKVVQDADRLDAIGAVGIARAFMFAGVKGHGLYGDDQSAYAHFFHKLLRLKDMMNTETARDLTEERHDFMVQFIGQLEKDAPGIDAKTS